MSSPPRIHKPMFLRFWDFTFWRFYVFWDFLFLRFYVLWDFTFFFEILRFRDFEILRFWDFMFFEILRFWSRMTLFNFCWTDTAAGAVLALIYIRILKSRHSFTFKAIPGHCVSCFAAKNKIYPPPLPPPVILFKYTHIRQNILIRLLSVKNLFLLPHPLLWPVIELFPS